MRDGGEIKFILSRSDKNRFRQYYNDLNEKLITSTNNSEVPAWEVNLNKN